MIIDVIRQTAVDYVEWSARRSYTKERIIDEFTDYMDMLVDDGSIVVTPNSPKWEWIEPNTIMFEFETNEQFVGGRVLDTIEYVFHHLASGSDDINQAYDRAMRGI